MQLQADALDRAHEERDDALREVERLRDALDLYACAGRPACTEPQLKDGTCARDYGGGACGDHARAALTPEPPA